VTPHAVELVAQGLRITWDDKTVCYPAALLRAACRCAHCQAAKRRGQESRPAADVAVVGCEAIGGYGLQLRFGDGHERGIFPFVYLRALIHGADAPVAAGH
jgi:DUF971 family protein